MVLGVLAPTLSRAMAAGTSGATLAEVCTPAGIEWVAMTRSPTDVGSPQPVHPDGDIAHALDHCHYCVTPLGNGLPSANHTPASFAVTGAALLPPLFLSAPRPLFAWSPLHPRAPPFSA